MKRSTRSRQGLLISFGLLALAVAGCSQGSPPDDDHGHAHDGEDAHEHGGEDHVDDHPHEGEGEHAHEDEDHGHAHSAGKEAHQHAAGTGEPTLGFSLTQSPTAGEALTVSLILNDPDGQAVTADDMAPTDGEKLHVMIVDEGLEDFVRLHPEAGPDGLYEITFTPEYPRTYRVWTHYALADGEDAHSHGEEEDDHHHGEAAASKEEILLSDALIVGEETAPALGADNVLIASADGLKYELGLANEVTIGEPVRLNVTVSGPDGSTFQALEPLRGSYGHLVSFSQGATSMVQAHSTGDHPHDDTSRGGPKLQFEMTFEEAGPHRLFLRTKAEGVERSVAFQVDVMQ